MAAESTLAFLQHLTPEDLEATLILANMQANNTYPSAEMDAVFAHSNLKIVDKARGKSTETMQPSAEVLKTTAILLSMYGHSGYTDAEWDAVTTLLTIKISNGVAITAESEDGRDTALGATSEGKTSPDNSINTTPKTQNIDKATVAKSRDLDASTPTRERRVTHSMGDRLLRARVYDMSYHPLDEFIKGRGRRGGKMV